MWAFGLFGLLDAAFSVRGFFDPRRDVLDWGFMRRFLFDGGLRVLVLRHNHLIRICKPDLVEAILYAPVIN